MTLRTLGPQRRKTNCVCSIWCCRALLVNVWPAVQRLRNENGPQLQERSKGPQREKGHCMCVSIVWCPF